MKYRVVKEFGEPGVVHRRFYDAQDIIDNYGLKGIFTVEEVIIFWEKYSESMCAGWMCPSKERVESVFGVELEEIND